MASQLFRQEALNSQSEKLWGNCIDLHPLRRWAFCSLLLLITCAAMGVLVSGNYQRKETVQGVLVPDKGAVKVRVPTDGIVEVMRTGEGQQVGKGEVLLVMDTAIAAAGGVSLAQQMLVENERQLQFLTALLRQARNTFPDELAHLETVKTSLESRLRAQRKLFENESGVRDMLESRVNRISHLRHRQLLSASDFEAMRMELLAQENTLQRAQLELDNTRQSLEQNKENRRKVIADHRQEFVRLKQELSTLTEQKLRLLSQHRIEIVSPVTGTIAVLNRQAGQVVRAGEVMMSIIQDNSVLEAELLVPSRAIGFLKSDLPVNLRFDAFPYRKMGGFGATIKRISNSSLQPAENDQGALTKEPYFKVVAKLDSQSIQAYGGSHLLRPGMQFQANILLENRTLAQWLLEPLTVRRGGP